MTTVTKFITDSSDGLFVLFDNHWTSSNSSLYSLLELLLVFSWLASKLCQVSQKWTFEISGVFIC